MARPARRVATDPAQRSQISWPFQSAVLIGLVAIAALRAPQAFTGLRLFADEATYFRYAYHHAWHEALFSTLLGYVSPLVNTAATLGAHVLPLELAPLGFLVLGLAAWLLVAWLVMLPGSPFRGASVQLLVVALLLVVPPFQGRFDLQSAQHYLCMATGLILVSSAPTPGSRWVRRGVLLLAGLEGATSSVLAPLFWLRAWAERSRERALQAAVLSACLVLHGAMRLFGPGSVGGRFVDRSVPFEPEVAVAAVPLQTLVLPLLGWNALEAIGTRVAELLAAPGLARAAVLAVSALLSAAVLALMADRRRAVVPGATDGHRLVSDGNLLAAAYVALVLLAFHFGLAFDGSRTRYLTSQSRYFAAPNAFFVVAVVLWAARQGGTKPLACRVLVAWLLVAGAGSFLWQPRAVQLSGPSWREEVAAWRADPSHRLAVWPARWPKLALAPREPVPTRSRNLLLLTIDTLRADRLGAWGYAPPTSPQIDALARESVAFRQARANAPWTLHSLASLLTSQYGATHRALRFNSRLDSAFTTLPEILRDAGFATAGIASHTYLGERFGLQQGIEEYDDTLVRDLPSRSHRAITSGEVTDKAIRWLEGRAADGRRWFLWVHYFDPHRDYRAHEGVSAGFGTEAESDLYDGEIAFTDRHVGRLLASLSRLRLAEDTLLVLTADHGEEFSEHGGLSHGRHLHREVLHVPLLFRAPGFASRLVDETVGLVDVLPTVLELMDLPAAAWAEGRSLVPALAGRELLARPSLAEASLYGAVRSIELDRWKLMRTVATGKTELYDVSADPFEQRDVAAEHPEMVRHLSLRMLSMVTEASERSDRYPRDEAAELSESELESLRSLGYVNDAGSSEVEP